MTSHDRRSKVGAGKLDLTAEHGQAMTEWLMWAALMAALGTILVTVAMPIIRRLPEVLAGWVASVAP